MDLFRGHKALFPKYTTPSGFVYDVFLSFRGQDTRKNFTDHLYTALVNAGFRTFRDDPELEKGKIIKEELENAIRQSRSSVIVFSKNYSSSRWCLDELVMILELNKTSDHIILPVFYDVDPSHVRKQAERLAKVPKYKENQSSERLNGWRTALREVADLAGMVLENEADGHQSKFIHNIVTVIQHKLWRVPLKDVEEMLQKKLSFINPVLDDAEGKQWNNSTVRAWLNELKEAVYGTEELLQKIKTEALRRKMETKSASSTSKVQKLNSSLPSHAFDTALIYPRVEDVLNRLDSIIDQRRDVLGMEASVGYRLSQTLPSTSLVEESSVCGRDDEKETLVKLLLSDDDSGNKITVIPIVGMGGIGKTTLAQLLYNDVRVEQHFDTQAWACVSENFDIVRISQQIFESLTGGACNIVNLDLLQSKLKAALKGKKFFLVLDDVWNKNYTEWEVLRRPFQFGAHGSKFIVTTRNQYVAFMVCTLEAHCLVPMSEKDGWALFEQHAFKNAGVGAHSHLEEIGRQIVRKCKGLPLAIKSLGGLLCSKLTLREWQSILDSEMWELSPDESEILPSLWLSYKHLPPHLRRCFSYCSIFPKNYLFKISELVYLWKAEDLLLPHKNKTAEEIGQDYFNDLISRSFFQLSIHGPRFFIMHDLINDLASFVSGEFGFRWDSSDSPNILSKTRHFSYIPHHPYAADGLQMFEHLQQAKCLHTFLPLRTYGWPKWLGNGLHDLFPKLLCLRVLNLSWYNRMELPDSINNLKHLRHLDLSYSSIELLPDTVCTLYNLQALLLSSCRSLIELPADFTRLINLSHLDITETHELKNMPLYMGNLKTLQMLPKFVLDKHTAGDNLPELKELQNLRGRLCISGLVHSSGLEAYILTDMKFLNELVLDWGRMSIEVLSEESEAEERGVLEKLQPHVNLERLTIENYGAKMFAGWPGYYSSSALVYLTLKNCKNCVSLPPLGQLPFLTELEINGLDGVVSVGSEFYYGEGIATSRVNKPFRSLRSLKFWNMREWKEWLFVGGGDIVTFPNLTRLVMERCWKLSSWPEQVYTLLPSLVDLELWERPKLECFPEGGFPPKLKSLVITTYGNLNGKSLRRLTSLTDLRINMGFAEKVDWFEEEEEEEEEEGLLPSILTFLDIYSMYCETIDGAKWFGHLNSLKFLRIISWPALRCLPENWLPTALETLSLSDCRALQCLPDSGLPSSLSHLIIDACPLLEKRCQRGTGEDWPKIAHIPTIEITGELEKQLEHDEDEDEDEYEDQIVYEYED